MKKVSVIVPVYNVEKYISKCLESLSNQTLKDIEVIIVNDGSPDNSQVIIDKYVQKFPDIFKSFTNKNEGVSAARNFGIKEATGKYIAFLDSDDYIENDTYEKLYTKAESKKFDLTLCNLKYVYEDGRKEKLHSIKRKDILNKVDVKKLFIDFYPVVWNGIYNASLFSDDINFKKGVWFEDVEFLYKIFSRIKSVGYIDDYLINYVQREGSTTSKYNHKLWDYLDNMETIIAFYKKNNIYDEYEKEIEYAVIRYLFATFCKQVTRSHDINVINQAFKDSKSFQLKYFPKYRRNKYFRKINMKNIYLITFNKTYLKFLNMLIK